MKFFAKSVFECEDAEAGFQIIFARSLIGYNTEINDLIGAYRQPISIKFDKSNKGRFLWEMEGAEPTGLTLDIAVSNPTFVKIWPN